MNVSFLGLGVMGYPMAGHLCSAEHKVKVYNRTPDKARKWAAQYVGEVAETIADASKDAEIIFACVGNDKDAQAVANAALAAAPAGALYIDHTTTSAVCAEHLAESAKKRGIGFIDAPVSGGEAGAVNGALSVMCGGSKSDLAKAHPVMAAYAKRIVHIGPCGHGQLCKAVNQIAIAGLLQALSEAAHFAKCTGIDTEKVLEAISGGAAQSWQMENRWQSMIKDEFDFGFAVDWMRKDLDIVRQEAARFGAHLPVTKQVEGYYQQVTERGGGRKDTSSLVTLLEQAEKPDQ